MKAVAVPILIILMATQAFSKWVLLLEFRWNQDYIAQNRCENRSKPLFNCGGKGQLLKKMAEEEKESSSQPQPTMSKFQKALFPLAPKGETSGRHSEKTLTAFTPYLIKKYTTPPFSIFHPPA